eukprot:Pompholyxophrys_punicea_v1_NODE_3_length_10569_cov_612.508655.p9 type:complete len:114 gc:universal NODE_3_length_10569_cov_612.508655:2789-3130(+)
MRYKAFVEGDVSGAEGMSGARNKHQPTSLVDWEADKEAPNATLDDIFGGEVRAWLVVIVWGGSPHVDFGNNGTAKDAETGELRLRPKVYFIRRRGDFGAVGIGKKKIADREDV